MNFMEKVKQNLKVGMIVKNYKELCNLLGEKVKTGESKQIQLRNWNRFFKYTKEGHKFIITKILDEEEQKIDGRSAGNHSHFTKEIAQNILMSIEIKHEQSHSQNTWLKIIGLANSEYGKTADIDTNKRLNYHPLIFTDFYFYGAGSSVKNYFQSALRYLESQKLATVETEYVALNRVSEERLEEIKEEYSCYSDKIFDQIYELKQEYIKQYGKDKFTELFSDNKLNFPTELSWDDFLYRKKPDNTSDVEHTLLSMKEYQKLKNNYCQQHNIKPGTLKAGKKIYYGILKENHWQTIYEKYTIIPNCKNISISCTKEEFILAQKKLNQKVYEHLVKIITDRYNKAYQIWWEKVQQQLPHCVKIGTPIPQYTQAYRDKGEYFTILNLETRLDVIEALIKL